VVKFGKNGRTLSLERVDKTTKNGLGVEMERDRYNSKTGSRHSGEKKNGGGGGGVFGKHFFGYVEKAPTGDYHGRANKRGGRKKQKYYEPVKPKAYNWG